jgi:hypothetical protein
LLRLQQQAAVEHQLQAGSGFAKKRQTHPLPWGQAQQAAVLQQAWPQAQVPASPLEYWQRLALSMNPSSPHQIASPRMQ